jgi:hypothetical protein
MARVVAAVILACGLLAVPAAVAKTFRPGDLRVCGREHCMRLADKRLLRAVNTFYWGSGSPAWAPRVRTGSPGFVLQLRNGYTTGIVAGEKLGRFQAYGVICGRFEQGRWYRFPPRAALGLRRLTADLRPVRVPRPPRSC